MSKTQQTTCTDSIKTDKDNILRLDKGVRQKFLEGFVKDYKLRQRATFTDQYEDNEYLAEEETIDYARQVSVTAMTCIAFDAFRRRLSEVSHSQERLATYSAMKDYREVCIAYTLLGATDNEHEAIAFTLTTNIYRRKLRNHSENCSRREDKVRIPDVTVKLNRTFRRLNKRMLGRKWESLPPNEIFSMIGIWENPMTNIHVHGFLRIPDSYRYNNIEEVVAKVSKIINHEWINHFKFKSGRALIEIADEPEGFAYYCTKSVEDFNLLDETKHVDWLRGHIYMSGLESEYEDKNGKPDLPNGKPKTRYKTKRTM